MIFCVLLMPFYKFRGLKIILPISKKEFRNFALKMEQYIIYTTRLKLFQYITELLSWRAYGKLGTFVFDVDCLMGFELHIDMEPIASVLGTTEKNLLNALSLVLKPFILANRD